MTVCAPNDGWPGNKCWGAREFGVISSSFHMLCRTRDEYCLPERASVVARKWRACGRNDGAVNMIASICCAVAVAGQVYGLMGAHDGHGPHTR